MPNTPNTREQHDRANALYDLIESMKCTVRLGARTGTPHVITESMSDFPLVALEKFIRYGFQRDVNDGVGGSDVSLADKVKGATKMLDNYKAGIVGRVAADSVDELTELARKLCKTAYIDGNRAAWDAFVAKAGKEDFKKKMHAELDRVITLNPGFVDDAKAELARRAEKPAIKLNL